MTQPEIKAKADQAVEMFKPHADWDDENGLSSIKSNAKHATQCAILMYEDRVKLMKKTGEEVRKMLKTIGDEYGFDVDFKDGKDYIESLAILTELKSRL